MLEGISGHEVSYQDADDKAVYPYIVYKFTDMIKQGHVQVFNLDVDIWDNKQITTELENLTMKIWKALDEIFYKDEDMSFSLFASNWLNDNDEDTRLKRRKLIFELRYVSRK